MYLFSLSVSVADHKPVPKGGRNYYVFDFSI